MKVKDVMMRTPASCDAATNLSAAVEILWNRNCGILPITNSQGKVIGVVTDGRWRPSTHSMTRDCLERWAFAGRTC